MRIRILSDLHLEFREFEPPRVDAEVVVFAGDVHTGRNGIKWILKHFPDQPVIYVLGNHEFYGQKMPKLIQEIKALAQGSNVHVLENGSVRLGNVLFLGATLWTDFRLNGDVIFAEVTAQTQMTDFRRIRVSPSYRKFRPADARLFHAKSLEWLMEAGGGISRDEKVVVVTHHAPSAASIPPRYKSDPLNPAYASNLEAQVMASRFALWIHGHIHHASDYRIGDTRVVANPRGYPGEWETGFDPAFVVDL